jgi:transposase
MKKKILYIGLDVHKKSIDVAITDARANGKVRSYGKIDGTLQALDKLICKLKLSGSDLHFVYEAGPCGYPIYRHLTAKGHSCSVVAPSLVPKRSGDRIKTDRRDAHNLARLFRAGELTSIYIPTSEDEAIRDLLRCRVDIRRIEHKTRQQLLTFLLRQGLHYPGKKNWTKGHMNWLADLKLAHRAQQIVLQEYIDAANECARRIQRITEQIQGLVAQWSRAPFVQGLPGATGCIADCGHYRCRRDR